MTIQNNTLMFLDWKLMGLFVICIQVCLKVLQSDLYYFMIQARHRSSVLMHFLLSSVVIHRMKPVHGLWISVIVYFHVHYINICGWFENKYVTWRLWHLPLVTPAPSVAIASINQTPQGGSTYQPLNSAWNINGLLMCPTGGSYPRLG